MRHGKENHRDIDHFCDVTADQHEKSGRFGRMFPDLPGLYTNPETLQFLGNPTDNDAGTVGPMDGGRDSNPSETIDVGQVFFAQFVDHDITLDTMSSLTRVNDPSQIRNIRTPTLDLDCIYGDGPEGSPYLYREGAYLLTGEDDQRGDPADALRQHDLLRNPTGRAIIGDPRNDENRVLSQVQLGMIRFHNEVLKYLLDESEEDHPEAEAYFEEARELVTHHYHWAVIYDFLQHICGSKVIWDIFHNGRKFYHALKGEAFIPVEFSVAGFRFGHTLVPQTVQIQKNADRRALFGTIFGRGFTPLENTDGIVDLNEIFTTGNGAIVQKAEKMDSKLARTLLKLPIGIASNPSSLATRNLERGQSFMLPSGEAVAAKMEVDQADIDTVSAAADAASGGRLSGCTPLWYYMLMEAEVLGREDIGDPRKPGEGLGPMGARLVGEVMIGLMELDPRSFLATNRQWNPTQGLGDSVRTVGDIMAYTHDGVPRDFPSA